MKVDNFVFNKLMNYIQYISTTTCPLQMFIFYYTPYNNNNNNNNNNNSLRTYTFYDPPKYLFLTSPFMNYVLYDLKNLIMHFKNS